MLDSAANAVMEMEFKKTKPDNETVLTDTGFLEPMQTQNISK